MIAAALQGLIGLILTDVIPVWILVRAWRRGFGLARTWFWVRAALLPSVIWALVTTDTAGVTDQAFVAFDALCLAFLSIGHVRACRRLGLLRDQAILTLRERYPDFGAVRSVTLCDRCFDVAEGWRS